VCIAGYGLLGHRFVGSTVPGGAQQRSIPLFKGSQPPWLRTNPGLGARVPSPSYLPRLEMGQGVYLWSS